jgi:hypothetical protein
MTTFFEKFTISLKEKWLEFFRINRSWISLQMKVALVKTPDGGQRPNSYFILGAINALEPKLGNFMVPFHKLNGDPDKLVDVLGLNFDPDLELAKRSEEVVQAQSRDVEIMGLLPDNE